MAKADDAELRKAQAAERKKQERRKWAERRKRELQKVEELNAVAEKVREAERAREPSVRSYAGPPRIRLFDDGPVVDFD
jgi:hypothetical protein